MQYSIHACVLTDTNLLFTAFAARGVKFRSKTANPGQGGGCFLRDEVDHPEDVPKYLDLHKGPDEVHEFDAVLGDDADVEFTGTREPQGLIGDVSIRSKKIGERKLTLSSPPDMAVKSARKIILQKMNEDNRMLSRPLPMLVKHTIQMCIHKIIAVLYYRNRKVINKFQQEDLTSQLIRQELKIAGKTPIEEPSRPIELSAVKYEKKKEPPSAKVSLMQEQPTSIEPDEPMEQDEPKISPYAPPPEMATVSGPKDFRSYDEYPEEIQQAVIKWKKTVRYHEMHTKEQYTAIKKLKMELSQANRLIINKKMGAINQEEYTREETVDLRLCMIFEVKHKLEEKKKEKYEQKMKKAKMEKEKKKHKKEKEKEREKEKPKPKKHVLALSSTSSDSDSDLDLPKKTPPKTSQQTPQKEKHRVDPVPEGKADADVKRKLIAEKKEKEQPVVKVEATEKETAKKETEREKETIEEAKKSEPKSTSQKSETECSDKNPDLSEVDEEERKEDQNKKVAVKSEISTPEKAAESKSTKIEATKSNEVNVKVTSRTKKDDDDSGDNIFQKLSKDLTLQSKDSEDGSKTESSKDAEVKPSEDGMNQNDSLPVVSNTDTPENVPEVPQNDEVKAAEDTSPEKEEGPPVSKSRSRSVSRSSSSSGSSGRSPSNSRSRSRSVSRASSRSSRASSRSGSRASSNSGSRASSRSGSRSSCRASSRSGSNASSRSGSRGSAKSRSRSRSNSGSRSGSGSRAASPSRSRSRSKSSSVPRSRSGSNASSRSNSRSVSRSRSRSKSSSISRSRSRSNSESSSAASVKSASGSESNDEDGNLGKLSTSENKEAEQESTIKTGINEDSVRNMEGKDISNAGNEAKKDTSDANKEIEDDKEVGRKASPVQNLGIRSPERVEDDKIVASDSSGPASPKYPSSGSEAEAKEAEAKDPGGDERTIDTEMQEVIEQVINLQEQMGVSEKEPSTTVQDSTEGTQKATESEAAPKDTTEVEMQQATPEPTLEDDIRDAEISMETTNTPPEPEESAAAEAVDDDDDDDGSSDDDDSYGKFTKLFPFYQPLRFKSAAS